MSSNVVRLPTAAPRRVRNSAPAARAYRMSQPQWPRPPLPGYMQDGSLPRAFEQRARAAPETMIILAILKALPEDQREKVLAALQSKHRAAPNDISWMALILAGEVGC